MYKVFHWSFEESASGYGLDLKTYRRHGGYPARGSSPKILPLCAALYSMTLDADLRDEHFERSFEKLKLAVLQPS